MIFTCRFCGKKFNRLDNGKAHEKICKIKTENNPQSNKRPAEQSKKKSSKKAKQCQPQNDILPCIQKFGEALATHSISPTPENNGDLKLFLESSREQMVSLLIYEIQEKRALKWYAVTKVQFRQAVSATEKEHCEAFFRSNCMAA